MNRMQLHDADWERARARSRRSSLPVPHVHTALVALTVACAVLFGCGDDGTEGLSSCPDYKIVLTKTNELSCAPMEKKTGAAGSAAKTSTATGASTGTGAQATPGTKPPAAANSGSAGNAPAVPSGPWSCLQVEDTCSCQPGSDVGDSCRKPHPSCCHLVTMNNRVVGCLCVPSETDQCIGMQQDPATYPKVSRCPP